MGEAILTVEALSLSVNGRLVLKDVSFSLPPTGITALMGPVGTGKSSMVKWLCGKADPAIYAAEVRQADYFHAPLSRRNRPRLLGQKQGLGLTQMMLLLDIILADNPPLICMDEPTFGLADEQADRMLDRLSLLSRSRAVLLVSHNQREVATYAQTVMLLAGGRMQEHTPVQQFFTQAQTEAGRTFVGTGGVVLPGLDTPAHHLGAEFRPVPEDLGLRPVACNGRLRAVLGDRIFVHDVRKPDGLSRTDLSAMADVGLRTIVHFAPLSATEAMAAMAEGLTGLRLAAPGPADTLADLRDRCHRLQDMLTQRGPVVFLRRSGDRHTGAAVALFLVSLGIRADIAGGVGLAIDGQTQADPASESLLYDLELSLDLERDGSDPDAFVVEQPEIPWIERQLAERRIKSVRPAEEGTG